jgi:CheY-like chemotaxis protein
MAASAAEALELLRREPFDILISDLAMPEMDGYSLIERLRAEGQEIPAIALSAFASDEDRAKALGSGFDRYLSKPVEPAALGRTIGELLTGARTAS